MKKVICSYFLGLYSSAYPSRLASRRQNCLADCLALNCLADCLDLDCFPDCFPLDCPADYLDLNCLYLNYFFDCLALNDRARTRWALYFPAQTWRARNRPIVYQQDNLRLDPVEETVYSTSTQFKNRLTDAVNQRLQSARPDNLRAAKLAP